jgi:hypothetical protein
LFDPIFYENRNTALQVLFEACLFDYQFDICNNQRLSQFARLHGLYLLNLRKKGN